MIGTVEISTTSTAHHGEAAKHFDKRDYAPAAHAAHIAHGHARRSAFHGDEAATHYIEHYGKSGPTAEIA